MRYRLMATYRGVPYEAGLGPTDADVVLFAACPPPEDLGFEPATGHWRKPVGRAEVALWESRPTGVFRGEPCLVLDDLGDRLHIAYLGDDPYQAARLGYHQVEPAVFEVVTSREAVTELAEERVPHQFQLWHTAASWRPPEDPPPVERLAPSAGLAVPVTWAEPEADPPPRRPATIVPQPGAVTDATPVSPPAATTPGSRPAADPLPARPAIVVPQPGAVTDATPVSPPTATTPGSAPAADPLPARPAIVVPRPGAVTDATPVSPPAGPAAATPGSRPAADPVPVAPAGPTATASEAGLPLRATPAAPAATPAEPRPQPAPAETTPEAGLPPRATPAEPRLQPAPAETTPEAGLPLRPIPAATPAEPGPQPAPATPTATRSDPGLEPMQAGPVRTASRAEPAAPGQTRTRRGRAAGRSRTETRWIFSELASLAAIPPAAYAVDEEVDGATCLVRTAHGFEVFTASGGARHEVRLFHDEEAAYFYLFGLLAAEAVRDGRLAPLQR